MIFCDDTNIKEVIVPPSNETVNRVVVNNKLVFAVREIQFDFIDDNLGPFYHYTRPLYTYEYEYSTNKFEYKIYAFYNDGFYLKQYPSSSYPSHFNTQDKWQYLSLNAKPTEKWTNLGKRLENIKIFNLHNSIKNATFEGWYYNDIRINSINDLNKTDIFAYNDDILFQLNNPVVLQAKWKLSTTIVKIHNIPDCYFTYKEKPVIAGQPISVEVISRGNFDQILKDLSRPIYNSNKIAAMDGTPNQQLFRRYVSGSQRAHMFTSQEGYYAGITGGHQIIEDGDNGKKITDVYPCFGYYIVWPYHWNSGDGFEVIANVKNSSSIYRTIEIYEPGGFDGYWTYPDLPSLTNPIGIARWNSYR